jgi:hypothetical protein
VSLPMTRMPCQSSTVADASKYRTIATVPT